MLPEPSRDERRKPRILLGPGDPQRSLGSLINALKEYAEVISFSPRNADICYHVDEDSFHDILERLPEDWTPDFVIIRDGEYYEIPVGLEESPYPVIGLIGDWNLAFNGIASIIGIFDFIFTDRQGVKVFQKLGIENIEYFPLYGYDPGIHKAYDEEKKYDVCLIGNLNHNVQTKRAKALYRIAKLADKYKINIESGVYGADYGRKLSQSKIVFNQSIRGEVNMRTFEAPACGALLFLESDNLEVRDFFRDREDCVLYDNDNLEGLIEHYLLHESERQRIVKNMGLKIKNHSYYHRARKLIQRIKRIKFESVDRAFNRLPPVEKIIRRANYLVQIDTLEALKRAGKELLSGLQLDPENPILLNNLGVVYGLLSRFTSEESMLRKGVNCCNKATTINPNFVIANFNSALMHLELREYVPSLSRLKESALMLQRDYRGVLTMLGLYYPYPSGYDVFKVEWERALYENAGVPGRLRVQIYNLLNWKIHHLLGDVCLAIDPGDLLLAKGYYMKAVSFRADFGETYHKLGRVEVALGRYREGLGFIKTAMEKAPFYFPAWLDYFQILYNLGRSEECRAFCKEKLTVLKAFPNYKDMQDKFNRFWELCNHGASGHHSEVLQQLEAH